MKKITNLPQAKKQKLGYFHLPSKFLLLTLKARLCGDYRLLQLWTQAACVTEKQDELLNIFKPQFPHL